MIPAGTITYAKISRSSVAEASIRFNAVGCAGGIRLDLTLPYEKNEKASDLYALTLSGLHGGHSGMEINKGYENAIKILAEILKEAEGVRIASISGGNADNAIPRFAECIISLDSRDYLSEKIIPNDIVFKTPGIGSIEGKTCSGMVCFGILFPVFSPFLCNVEI